jgi:hypothetical protein
VRAGEQHRGPGRPAFPVVLLLGADHGLDLAVDRDERLAFHLGVVVAQVGGAVGVGDDAVPGQPGGAGDPQPAADQDDGDQPVGGAGPAVQVRGIFGLGHDVRGQRPGQPLRFLRVVPRDEHRGGGKGLVPAVAADRQQERVQLSDAVPQGAGLAGQLAVQAGQVAFQELPVGLVQALDAGPGGEGGEPGHGADAARAGGHAQPGGDPRPDPPLGEIFEPRLDDPAELQGGLPGGGDAQAARPPGVTGIFAVPSAFSFGQGGDLAMGVDQQSCPLPAVVSPGGHLAAPLLLAQRQQGGDAARGEHLDHSPDVCGPGPGGAVVAPPLQGVLQLQFQLRGQLRQVGALAGITGCLALARELRRIRAAVPSPAAVVVPAERGSRMRPHVAVADLAGRRRRLPLRRLGGSPPPGIGLPGTAPPAGMTPAQPAPGNAETAAADQAPAGRQRAPPQPGRRDGCRELAWIRPSCLLPPPGMTVAHPGGADGQLASVHQAHAAAEHRVGSGEHQHLSAELRAHRGHQLLQQAMGRDGRIGGPTGPVILRDLPGHQDTSRPVNQPAFSSAPRAS